MGYLSAANAMNAIMMCVDLLQKTNEKKGYKKANADAMMIINAVACLLPMLKKATLS